MSQMDGVLAGGIDVPNGAFIDGAWVSVGPEASGGSDAGVTSHNPVTGDVVWQGFGADADMVGRAIAAARAAFPQWARAALTDRIAMVEAYRDAMAARRGELAALISAETGKPGWETAGEASAVVGKVDISVAAYHDRTGARSSDTAFGAASLMHRPHGVMGVLGPFNFPAHLPNGHIVPALIAGNTIVFKPSELTPAVGAFLVDVWREAGLPAGVLNLVQGGRETGAALLAGELNGVLFTGSVDAGVMIHRTFAGRPDVILALEMGGNNPLIAWDFGDVSAAASIVLQSAFVTSGQRCTCARRLIVPRGEAGDQLVAAVIDLVDRVRVGAPDDDPEPFMGPLISSAAAARVLDAQAALVADGGRVLRAATGEAGSAFVTPGIVDVTGVALADAEVFGPLLQVIRVDDFDAAIGAANETKFGLSAGLISDDADLWARVHTQVRAGIMNWNRPTTGAASNMPFGGPGFSGNHRPSAYYAADYCAYPVASQTAASVEHIPTQGLIE